MLSIFSSALLILSALIVLTAGHSHWDHDRLDEGAVFAQLSSSADHVRGFNLRTSQSFLPDQEGEGAQTIAMQATRRERLSQVVQLFLVSLAPLAIAIVVIMAVHGYATLKWGSVSQSDMDRIAREVFVPIASTPHVSSNAGGSRAPPRTLLHLVLAAATLRCIDLTVVLPTSLLRTEAVGGHLADSGIVLGMAGLGAIIAIPSFVMLAGAKWGGCKVCLVTFAVTSLTANVGWVFSTSYSLLLISSFMKGFSSGVQAAVTYILTVFTSPDTRAQYFNWSSALALGGSAMGPGIASVLYVGIEASSLNSNYVQMIAPGVFMLVLMSCYLVLVVMFTPRKRVLDADPNCVLPGSQMELKENASRDDSVRDHPVLGPMLAFSKYKALVSLVLIGCIRVIIRYGFEAGQLIVLQYQYNLDPAAGGLVILLNVGLATCAMFLQARLKGKKVCDKQMLLTDMFITSGACLLMVVPLLAQYYLCDNRADCSLQTPGGLGLFLVLSFILYASNTLTTPLSNALCTQIAPDPSRRFLNKESYIMCLGIFADGVAIFFGPSIFRWTLERFSLQQAVLGLTSFGFISTSLVMLMDSIPNDSARSAPMK